MKYFLLGILTVLLFSCSKSSRFEILDPISSGVVFSNTITENDSINILTFDYTYNGGGVAAADFNNDSLADLFFSGNMVENKLFLNQGEMKFEDVSSLSGLTGFQEWCTAAIAVDLNADGWMDIYVPVSSTKASLPAQRQNLFFENQGLNEAGIPQFIEKAKAYGINDSGFSESAAFFDYDNDGDLDLYVLTNVIDHTPNMVRTKVTDGSYPNTDRLYENRLNEEEGSFINVSERAGITIEGFGLGINICDINQDGWRDVYITNDYVADDVLYINQKNGTFKDEAARYFKHTSNAAMGNDVADINNDGLMDMFALDMMPEDNYRKKIFVSPMSLNVNRLYNEYGYIVQYMRNTLQLNSGKDKDFQEISLVAGISETDWSWTPLFADFDNDGFRDLLISNGFPKDVTDRDFMAFRANSEQIISKVDLLAQIPEAKIHNYAFRNNGNLQFEDVSEDWGFMEPTFSSGATYADLDLDGDLDYIVNNTNQNASIYKNNSNDTDENQFLRILLKGKAPNTQAIGAKIIGEYKDGSKFYWENNPYRGYKGTIENWCHIGLGNKQLKYLKVVWPLGEVTNIDLSSSLKFIRIDEEMISKQNSDIYISNNELELFSKDSLSQWLHEEFEFLDYNIQNLIPFQVSQLGPGTAVGDINGDGLDDLVVGGAKFKGSQVLFQTNEGRLEAYNLGDKDNRDKKSEDTGLLLFDADGDGDNDLYVVSGGNEDYPGSESFQDRFYENINGQLTESSNVLPSMKESGSCVRAIDYDNDGDLDLFVGGRLTPTQYPKATKSTLLRNDSKAGKIKFVDVTKDQCPELLNFGMVNDAIWTDFDGDGLWDLFLAGDFTRLTFYRNTGKAFERQENTGLEKYKGFWSSLSSGDFDGDGDIDYIAGNVGLNTRCKGTLEEPAIFYSGDFDGNGVYDIFPFVYLKKSAGSREKVLAPYNTREDVAKMYNPTRTRFVDFKSFTEATPETFFTAEELTQATVDEVNTMESVFIKNLGNGTFELTKLPIQAQFAPMKGMVVFDYDLDGDLDILSIGNMYGHELQVGKLDANNGLFLQNDGQGGFESKRLANFNVAGDSKSMVPFVKENGVMSLAVSQNRGEGLVFDFLSKINLVDPAQFKGKTKVSYVINDKKVTQELNGGSSYLSNGTSHFVVPLNAEHIEFK